MGRKKNENTLPASTRTSKWRRDNSTAFTIKLNNETQKDVIDVLRAAPNKTQYIVDLIRQDVGYVKEKTLFVYELSQEMAENDIAHLIFDNGSEYTCDKDWIKFDKRVVKSYTVEELTTEKGTIKKWIINIKTR